MPDTWRRNGDFIMHFLSVLLRGVLSLGVLFVLTRLIGRRQVQQLTFFDYVIGISVGSIAAEMVLNRDVPWADGVLGMAVYSGAALLISWVTGKNLAARRVLTGSPVVLLQKGELLEENFKKTKLDLNEFLAECRAGGYFDLSQLDYVLAEPNGKLSFLPGSKYQPLTPQDIGRSPSPAHLTANVILDGHVMERHLRLIGKDEAWLRQGLREQGVESPEEVFLAISSGDSLIVYRKHGGNPAKNVLE